MFRLILFSLFIAPVLLLDCFQCSSSLSWQDCDKQGTNTTCNTKQNACYTKYILQTQNGQQNYAKFIRRCYPSGLCTYKEACAPLDTYRTVSCRFVCCNTSRCNTALPRKRANTFIEKNTGKGCSAVRVSKYGLLLNVMSWVIGNQ
ncbi:hypothetical protein AC249_AIPGENE8309 [Exaiptasia diaphana]|nr:hypothetical protein AC249_AIPGENE8309 [Exaiptasia diaphana]